MKTVQEVEEKIKEVKKKMTDPEARSVMQYWLGYLRALEWTIAEQ